MSDETAYPLSWPSGWPRTQFRLHSAFKQNKGPISMTRSTVVAAKDIALATIKGAKKVA